MYSRQLCSSDRSPQSLSRSHLQVASIQRPLAHFHSVAASQTGEWKWINETIKPEHMCMISYHQTKTTPVFQTQCTEHYEDRLRVYVTRHPYIYVKRYFVYIYVNIDHISTSIMHKYQGHQCPYIYINSNLHVHHVRQ